jgi:hypothetical protein
MRCEPRARRGQALLMMSFTITAMFGIMALVVDVGWANYRKQAAQAAADSAAVAAIRYAVAKGLNTCGDQLGCYPATPYTCPATPPGTADTNIDSACMMAAANGFTTDLSHGRAVNVYSNIGNPPRVGGAQGVYWTTVVITETSHSFFGPLVGGRLNPAARATAAQVYAGGGQGNMSQACVDVLDTSGNQAFKEGGGSEVRSSCGVWDNSTASDCNQGGALYVTGDSTLRATAVSVSGVDCIDPGSQIRVPHSGVDTSVVPVPDPFSSLPAPPVSGCQPGDFTNPQATPYTPAPGCYTSFDLTNGNSLNLSAGVYVINGGSFNLQSGPVTSSGGVTIYLTNGATVNIGGGTQVTLSAPTSGTYAGVLFFQDKGDTGTSTFGGGAADIFNGTIYAPGGKVLFTNGLQESTMAVVAKDVDFESGTYKLDSDPGGSITGINSGSSGPGATFVITMVE